MKRLKAVVIACLVVSLSAIGASYAGAGEQPAIESASPSTEAAAPEAMVDFGVQSIGEGCYANAICTYTGANFDNYVGGPACSSSGFWYIPTILRAARNRCGNKTNWLAYNGKLVACMNPGGDRPNPGAYNSVKVAAYYGHFC